MHCYFLQLEASVSHIVPYLSRWWTSPELMSLQSQCQDAEWTSWITAATLWSWKSLVGQPNLSWSSSSCSKMPGVAQRSLLDESIFCSLCYKLVKMLEAEGKTTVFTSIYDQYFMACKPVTVK